MKKLRIGLIGLGKVAELHLRAYQDLKNAEVTAGADKDFGRLTAVTNAWGIRGYTDYEELLAKEKPDIVCVLVPALYHRQVTEKAAQYKAHVLCEKPMAVTREDAEAMIAACRTEGVKLFYGASYRFLPACIKAKQLIDSGLIGNIQLMMEYVLEGQGPESFHGLGPHHYPTGGPGGGGLGLVDHGIHLIDLFRYYASSEISAIYGRGNYSGSAPVTEFMTMVFESGAVGQLIYNEATFSAELPNAGMFSQGAGWAPDGSLLPAGAWQQNPQSIRIYGDKGALRIFHYANQLFLTDRDGQRQIFELPGKPSPGNFTLQMESFISAVINDEEPQVGGNDGLKALELLQAAYRR